MTESPGREGGVGRSTFDPRTGSRTARVLGVGLGGLVLLPAVYALVLCYTLLSGASMDEGPWWLLFFGVVAAYGLTAPTVLRLWRRMVEGLRGSDPGRKRALRGRKPAVAGGVQERAERQILEAIERRGEITPVRAALETALTVAEAERMLDELAEKGHLEVRAREGRLVYSF